MNFVSLPQDMVSLVTSPVRALSILVAIACIADPVYTQEPDIGDAEKIAALTKALPGTWSLEGGPSSAVLVLLPGGRYAIATLVTESGLSGDHVRAQLESRGRWVVRKGVVKLQSLRVPSIVLCTLSDGAPDREVACGYLESDWNNATFLGLTWGIDDGAHPLHLRDRRETTATGRQLAAPATPPKARKP